MNTRDIEIAAQMFFAMCIEHPELCPHLYEWKWTKHLDGGREERHYKCQVCGHELVEIKE